MKGVLTFSLCISGLAFHPLDGILQALPHSLCLFFMPIHFTTHLVLIFIEGIWTANIHDCIHGKLWPVMGAGYHTIHHTTYRHNYGHYTIWMDWLFGTLHNPEEDEGKAMWWIADLHWQSFIIMFGLLKCAYLHVKHKCVSYIFLVFHHKVMALY